MNDSHYRFFVPCWVIFLYYFRTKFLLSDAKNDWSPADIYQRLCTLVKVLYIKTLRTKHSWGEVVYPPSSRLDCKFLAAYTMKKQHLRWVRNTGFSSENPTNNVILTYYFDFLRLHVPELPPRFHRLYLLWRHNHCRARLQLLFPVCLKCVWGSLTSCSIKQHCTEV